MRVEPIVGGIRSSGTSLVVVVVALWSSSCFDGPLRQDQFVAGFGGRTVDAGSSMAQRLDAAALDAATFDAGGRPALSGGPVDTDGAVPYDGGKSSGPTNPPDGSEMDDAGGSEPGPRDASTEGLTGFQPAEETPTNKPSDAGITPGSDYGCDGSVSNGDASVGPPTASDKQRILNLPGLRLWLDAAEVTEDIVSRWPDLSPHGNHAGQDVEAYRPTLTKTDIGPAVRFDAVNDHLVVRHATSLDVLAEDVAIFGVYAHQTDAFSGDSIGVIYFKGVEGSPSTGLGLEANWINESRAAFSVQDPPGVLLSTDNGYNDNVVRLVVGYRYSANQAELRIDGKLDRLQTVPYAYMDTQRDGFIGAQVQGNGVVWQPLDGIIAELMIVAPVSREAVEVIESYFVSKYALPRSEAVAY